VDKSETFFDEKSFISAINNNKVKRKTFLKVQNIHKGTKTSEEKMPEKNINFVVSFLLASLSVDS